MITLVLLYFTVAIIAPVREGLIMNWIGLKNYPIFF